MTIAEILFPKLQEKFSQHQPRIELSPEAVAVFPAACPEVGDLSIYDDGDEATVVIENITHHHVNPYDPDMSPEDRANWATKDVVQFLDELFADRVLLWVHRHAKSGGWRMPFEGDIPADVPPAAELFVWSRRIRA